ncbi:MAG: DUF2855 family protein [Alphaproteobacteria bacterium]|nr:DUF2855 family protein [Alphaproteobacteria bacterium]
MNWALSIDKANIADAHIVEENSRSLGEGEIRLGIHEFALTANNITYAAFGAPMRYWDFFPGADGRGRLPVWGFAEITESRCEGLDIGERVYGYFPAANELIVTPGRIDPHAFIDMSGHRAELPPAYNRYVRCAADPAWSKRREPAQMVLQPLFITSFLIAHFLREENAFGAETILLSSASSKTALALAWLLHKTPIEGVTVMALTSKGNGDFVRGLGFYDSTCLYDDLETLKAGASYGLIDFAGNGELNRRLHGHLVDDLKANIRVGGAHWENSAPASDLPGPKPQFFFAPDHARARIKEWGQAEFDQRYKTAWDGFVDAAADIFNYQQAEAADGALGVYNQLIEGGMPAQTAQTVGV